MRFRRQKGRLDERQCAPLCDRDMAGPRQLQDRQAIDRGLFYRAIAVNNSQAFDDQFGGGERQKDGTGIVDAGIGVDQDLSGGHGFLSAGSAQAGKGSMGHR